MRRTTMALAASVFLWYTAALPATEDKPKDLILGKWEPVDKLERVQAVIEFLKDGRVKIDVSSQGQDLKLEGTYKFAAENTVELQMDAGGKKESKKIKIVKLTRDEFVMKDEGKDEEEKFKRVK